MHASKLQPSGFQAQRFNVSALDIQDLMLNQAFPSQEQRHSLLIARPAKHLDHGCLIISEPTVRCSNSLFLISGGIHY
jgi:hypothetical protein